MVPIPSAGGMSVRIPGPGYRARLGLLAHEPRSGTGAVPLTPPAPGATVAAEPGGAFPVHDDASASDLPALRMHLAFYREADPGYRVAEHHYDIHEWYVCLHGGFTVRLDGDVHDLGAEQSLLVRPGTRRSLAMHQRAPGYLVLVFEARGIDLSALEQRVLAMPASLREDLHALVQELHRPGEDSPGLIHSLILRLLIGHKRARAGTTAAQPADALPALNDASQRSLVEAAETYLRDHLDQPIPRREIAAALHLSGSHLARVFRAVTGRTLVQRHTELRLQRAKALLLESTLSITQVATAVGMVSFSHFARTFKRAVGVSPGTYRRTRGSKWA